MRRWEPREIEVRATDYEIAAATGYGRWRAYSGLLDLERKHGAVLRTRSIRDPATDAIWLVSHDMVFGRHERQERGERYPVAPSAEDVIDSLTAALGWSYGWPRPRGAPVYPDAANDGTRRLVDGITRAHGATLEQWRHVIASAALDVRDNAAIPYRLDLYALHQRWDRHLARELEPWEVMPWV